MKKFLTILAVLSIAALPALAAAQGFGTPAGVPPEPAPVSGASAGTVYGILNQVITILFYVLMFAAVICILLAAFYYLTAQGDGEKVGKAKATLLYAVIAIVIAVLARSVPFIVATFVRTNVGP
jgi:hypothetical protein